MGGEETGGSIIQSYTCTSTTNIKNTNAIDSIAKL